MADIVQQYYEKLLTSAFSTKDRIYIPKTFHSRMKLITKLLENDSTSLISTILEFMVHTATVDINFISGNSTLDNILRTWKENLNINLNIDIPRGLRSFTEQFFRERWKSSFLVVRIRWKKQNDYWLPHRMWLMDGASIYVKNDSGKLNTNEYYFGKPTKKSSNKLSNTEKETVIVRKPYNHWYDKYPTPFLVRKGALYHALFKTKILEKQAEVLDSALPYQLLIKMGSDEAIRKGQMPNEEDMKNIEKQYQDKKDKMKDYPYSKGLVGTFAHDVNFEELIPDYIKALDEKIIKPTDKNILNSLGLIELRGFSSNREEAILNPKVLVEEVEDAVLDYIEFMKDIVYLIQEKNKDSRRNLSKNRIIVEPGIIKSFITDEMRTMIRSWYDRGIVAKESALENTTPLAFERQIRLRENERKEGLNYILYPPVTQNLEKDINDPSEPEQNEDIPEDKKKNTPEVEEYKNACSEEEYITERMKTIRSIPQNIRDYIPNKDIQREFKKAFNKQFIHGTKLGYDNKFREQMALEYAYNAIRQYLQSPYTKNSDLPTNVRKLPSHAQTIFRNAFNNAIKTHDETTAFKIAWSAVKRIYKKNKDGDWVRK